MVAQALKVGAVIHCKTKCCNKHLKKHTYKTNHLVVVVVVVVVVVDV
jgi:hypothetical protein